MVWMSEVYRDVALEMLCSDTSDHADSTLQVEVRDSEIALSLDSFQACKSQTLHTLHFDATAVEQR